MFVCYLVAQDFLNHGKRTLRKYVLSRYLIFNLPPCSSLFVLEHLPPPAPPPPHPRQGLFVLASNHPLPLNFYASEI